MVICPSCGSSRIRNDYKPAPFYLRIFGIRSLLCDHCNYPFRAFSPLPPKTRRPRTFAQKADVFNPAPNVDLAQIKQPLVIEKTEFVRSNPPQGKFDLTATASLSASQQVQIVTDQITPVRNDLRTEITKVHAQGAKARTNGKLAANLEQALSSQACPECDSRNVKRRHRNFIERTFLSFTEHKAYSCRNCGASFYAKNEKHQSHPSTVG
jgi:transposase-like protein